MKIGILTFHYVTNYGAVLQTYALQRYLEKRGHEAVVIDYFPKSRQKPIHKRLLARRMQTALKKLIDLRKEIHIDRFRKQNLHLTARYNSIAELQTTPPLCDCYITGSDQIWNQHFTSQGENYKPTLSYFLDFGHADIKRVSYAASFGCTSYPDDLMAFTKPALARFDALSVREATGSTILKEIGFNCVDVVPDPTLLLNQEEYKGLFANKKLRAENAVFIYALHDQQEFMASVINEIIRTHKALICGSGSHWAPGIDDWLNAISSAKAVVTNSFHGVVFSILFEKDFVAVPVEGPNIGMNDRLYTLLGQLGLEERILSTPEARMVNSVLTKKINWKIVTSQLEALRLKGIDFLSKALGQSQGKQA